MAAAGKGKGNGNSKDGWAKYKLEVLAETPDVKVWLVKGHKVRQELAMDFFQGGHGYVPWFDRFIPVKEVWIDDALPVKERPAVIVHELYEREQMKKGATYDKAHKGANVVESKARKNVANAKLALANRGVKAYWCTHCLEWHGYNDRGKTYVRHMKYIESD